MHEAKVDSRRYVCQSNVFVVDALFPLNHLRRTQNSGRLNIYVEDEREKKTSVACNVQHNIASRGGKNYKRIA